MNNLIKIGEKYYSDIQIDGRRIRRALSVNKRIAEEMVADMKAMRRAKKWGGIPNHVSWRFFKTRLYESLASEGISLDTIYEYKLAFKRYEDAIPIQYLEDLTAERLDYVRTKWGKKLGKWAIENHLRFIKAAMRRAENWKWVGMQNWRVIKPLPVVHRKVYYTAEQLAMAIEKSPEPYSLAMRIMGRAGLRVGEVTHLEWSDCDLDNGLLQIKKKDGWGPKAKRQVCKDRVVPMSDDLLAHLKDYYKAHGRPQGLILGGSTRKLWYEIKKALKVLGLPGFPHAFRHTLASHLHKARQDLKQIANVMGHSSITTTAIYTHTDQDDMKTTIKQLPELCTAFVRGSTSQERMKKNEKEARLPS